MDQKRDKQNMQTCLTCPKNGYILHSAGRQHAHSEEGNATWGHSTPDVPEAKTSSLRFDP